MANMHTFSVRLLHFAWFDFAQFIQQPQQVYSFSVATTTYVYEVRGNNGQARATIGKVVVAFTTSVSIFVTKEMYKNKEISHVHGAHTYKRIQKENERRERV